MSKATTSQSGCLLARETARFEPTKPAPPVIKRRFKVGEAITRKGREPLPDAAKIATVGANPGT